MKQNRLYWTLESLVGISNLLKKICQIYREINYSNLVTARLGFYLCTDIPNKAPTEFGPEFGFLQTQYFHDASVPSLNDNVFFKAQMIRAAIGFGGYILGNERVTIVSGLRILYDLSDLRSKQAMDKQFPYHNYENLANKPFQAFDIQLCMELNFSLGFLVRKSCGKRTLMFHW